MIIWYDIWYMIYDIWYMICDMWYMNMTWYHIVSYYDYVVLIVLCHIIYSIVQWNTTQYMTKHNTFKHSTILDNKTWYDMIWYNTMECTAMKCNIIWCKIMRQRLWQPITGWINPYWLSFDEIRHIQIYNCCTYVLIMHHTHVVMVLKPSDLIYMTSPHFCVLFGPSYA